MIAGLVSHLWQSTFFALAAALLTLAFRANRASVRYWLWLTASLKFVVPFSLLVALGNRFAWTSAAQRLATPSVSLAFERLAEPIPEPLLLVSSVPAPDHRIAIAILSLWACGFAAIALFRLRSWLRISAAVRASTPLAIPAAVDIRSAPGLLEPGVVGWLRPVLLLPEGIVERLAPSQLEAVLAHELCHVRRRDNLFASLHMAVEAVFWFHPLVWWIGGRLVEERERACDEGVLSLGGEPRIYADAILNVCKLYVESPLVCVSGVTGANLKRRIEAIMTNHIGRRLNWTKKFVLTITAAVALTFPIAIGIIIGAGSIPAIQAQIPAAPQAPALSPQPRAAALPEPQVSNQNRRQIAILFDFTGMTGDQQSRARQSALDFVRNTIAPADLVSIMSADSGRVSVVQDFTNDRSALEFAINAVKPLGGNASIFPALEAATRILGAISDKKALMYFISTSAGPGPEDQFTVQNLIKLGQESNVAFFPIDVREASTPARDESQRRAAEAQLKFGSFLNPMARTYIKYGPPDQIDNRTTDPQNPSQTWRYNYVETLHSRAEFEFTGGAVRIVWPLPSGTYEGTPEVSLVLADAVKRQFPSQPESNPIAGFAGRHSSFLAYSQAELQTLSIPMDSFIGRVRIFAQICPVLNTGEVGLSIAGVHDSVDAAPGAYQARFTLQPGAYRASVLVREESGKMYGETIHFEVK